MDKNTTNESTESASEQHTHEVYSDNVAVPEVRTGKVDLEGDFHKEQLEHAKSGITYDTVAVPEYHTGKCPPWDPDCEEKHDKHKHHGMLADLTRTLFNGTPDK